MKNLSLASFAAVLLFSLAAFASGSPALSPTDKQFLGGYAKIQAALAADDLVSAKKAADDLGASGSDLAKSKALEDARTAFATLSVTAEKLTAGQPGYYAFHCAMVNQDWVQTSLEVANPYTGKEMAACGAAKN